MGTPHYGPRMTAGEFEKLRAEETPEGPRAALYAFHREMVGRALEIMQAKNQDYASEADPLANFRLCEQMGLVPTSTGILIRLSDKIRRLAGFEGTGSFAVEDEKLEDTVLDAINYLIIYAYQRQSVHNANL